MIRRDLLRTIPLTLALACSAPGSTPVTSPSNTGDPIAAQGAAPEATSAPWFEPAVPLALSDRPPADIVAADVDGDGKLDLISAISEEDAIDVRFNDGDGRFSNPHRSPAGRRPIALVSARLDGDRDPDLAVLDAAGDTITILLGQGHGRGEHLFGPPHGISVRHGYFAQAIAAGDFDRDMKTDLAAVTQDNQGNSTIEIFLGRGDGTFEPARSFPSPAYASSISLGDVNGDGRLDAVVTAFRTVAVFLGRGNGSLYAAGSIDIGKHRFAAAAAFADMNHDKKADLVVLGSMREASFLSVYLGRGDGHGFELLSESIGARFTAGLRIADVDGDGHPDAITSNLPYHRDHGFLAVALNKGDGTLRDPIISAAEYPNGGLALGDFDGDGKLDAALSGFQVNVLDGKSGAKFGRPALYGTSSRDAVDILAADFNNDGHLDLLTANYETNDLTLFLGGEQGRFRAPIAHPAGNPTFGVAAADFNGDGKEDVAIVQGNFAGSGLVVRMGDGEGGFGPAIPADCGAGLTFLEVGDVNGDGKPDLVSDDTVSYPNQALAVCFGEGGGRFTAPKLYDLGTSGFFDIVLADVDGDHRLDVITVDATDNTIGVLINRGHGVLAGAVKYPAGIDPWRGAAADMNGDGYLDIVLAGSLQASVLLNQGAGVFGAPSLYDLPGSLQGAQGLAVADFNRDGRPDAAVSGAGLAVLPGTGGGRLGPAMSIALPFGGQSQALVAADLDGDGSPDLASADQASPFFQSEYDDADVFFSARPYSSSR